jgi:O-antigen/teichoic acid export membrane protein
MLSRKIRLPRFLKDSLWAYAADGAGAAIGLFVIPIWSRRVGPDEYARWLLVASAIEIIGFTGLLGLATFGTKVLYRYDDPAAPRHFGIIVATVTATTAALVGGLALLAPMLAAQLTIPALALYAAGAIVLCKQVNDLAILFVGSRLNYSAYFVLTALRVALNAAFLLYFLLVRGQGFLSWIWAALVTEACVLVPAAYYLRVIRVERKSVRLLKFGVRFSIPGFLMDVLGWGQARLDRYLFASFGLMGPLGQFAVGQSVAATYGMVTRPAKVLAQRMVGRELERDRETPRYLEFFHAYGSLGIILAFATSLFLGDVISLVVAREYERVRVIIPLLIFGMYCRELFSIYHSLMFRYLRAWFPLWGAVIGAVIVIVANVLLIRPFGFVGAALAQVAGGLAIAVFAHEYARRVSPRADGFGEKVIAAAVVCAIALVTEHFEVPVVDKLLLAIVGIAGYSAILWRRRHIYFRFALARTVGS